MRLPFPTLKSLALALGGALILCSASRPDTAQTTPSLGPLRPLKSNPRYFTDGSGKAIYLTGSHTWNNFQDFRPVQHPFSYADYLDFLQRHNHNFFRLWTWESPQGKQWAVNPCFTVSPLPYPRTGPELARDMLPKFNLDQFNQEYFDRLRSRVIDARDRGVYVSIMLFQGFDVTHDGWLPWPFHPYNAFNNINGIDGDPRHTGEGKATHTLEIPAVTQRQEAYVRKVIDTVNDLTNVLYEISNESDPQSTEWQYRMIDFIHKYEAGKPMQHPVGMTFQWSKENNGSNKTLMNSPADWISPDASDGYGWDPPASDGSKVIISDTDHLWGAFGTQQDNEQWVWKSFLRGLNTLYMDKYDYSIFEATLPPWPSVNAMMGQTRSYAETMNLAAMVPWNELSSTRYCLADPGTEYLVYQPGSGSFYVDLSGPPTTFSVEWFNPHTSATLKGGTIRGGTHVKFVPPFAGTAVLYLKKGEI